MVVNVGKYRQVNILFWDYAPLLKVMWPGIDQYALDTEYLHLTHNKRYYNKYITIYN